MREQVGCDLLVNKANTHQIYFSCQYRLDSNPFHLLFSFSSPKSLDIYILVPPIVIL